MVLFKYGSKADPPKRGMHQIPNNTSAVTQMATYGCVEAMVVINATCSQPSRMGETFIELLDDKLADVIPLKGQQLAVLGCDSSCTTLCFTLKYQKQI